MLTGSVSDAALPANSAAMALPKQILVGLLEAAGPEWSMGWLYLCCWRQQAWCSLGTSLCLLLARLTGYGMGFGYVADVAVEATAR